MNKLFAIARKDTTLRFSGLAEWLFFLILPIIFTVVLAGGTGQSDDARIRLVIVDQAQTPLSAAFISELESSTTIRGEVLALEKAEQEFSGRRVSAVLVIPAEFNQATLEQGQVALDLRQQPSDMNALVAQRAILTVVQHISSAVDIANRSTGTAEAIHPFESAAARQAYFSNTLQAAQSQLDQAPTRIKTVRGATPDQIEYDPAANSSAGQLITWVFIPLIGISSMFAYERQKGTLRRLLITPTRKSTYLFGTISGQVVLALLQMLLLIGFGILILKINWGREPAALALLLITSSLAAAALGTTLGTFVKTESQAGGLSVMLGMVMALLGGCWYPIELFPTFVRTAVKVLPTTWAMQGMLDLLLRGKGLAGILPEAMVLLGFAALFFLVGVWRFRYE